ncbi:MAG: carboxypeptidase-like regulatory domain-containing protein, partial [Phycisphaerae bacterium]
MRRNWITILPLVLLFGITDYSIAQQVKKITCTGKVMDSNAQPVSGADVICYEEFFDYGEGRIRWEVLGQAKTNSEGKFSQELEVEDRDNIWVAARKEGLSLGWAQAAYVFGKLEFIIRLGKPSVLAGKVVDETGRAIVNAKLRLCLKSEQGRRGVTFTKPEDWFMTTTDDKGKFGFGIIPIGATADFWVEAPGRVCCWTFWETDLVDVLGSQFAAGRTDVRIVLGPEAKIQGRVIEEDTGNAVDGVRLLARSDRRYASYFCADLTVSDKNGRFCFKGLPADAFSLQVVPPRDRMADWVGKDVKAT